MEPTINKTRARMIQFYKDRSEQINEYTNYYKLKYNLMLLNVPERVITALAWIIDFDKVGIDDIFQKLTFLSKDEILNTPHIGPKVFKEIANLVHKQLGKTPLNWRLTKCKCCGQILKGDK